MNVLSIEGFMEFTAERGILLHIRKGFRGREQVLTLSVPVEVGERKPAKYAAIVGGAVTFAPTIKSAHLAQELAYQEGGWTPNPPEVLAEYWANLQEWNPAPEPTTTTEESK